jgi:UDP-N-acetylglucosamine pyrophosphorylase
MKIGDNYGFPPTYIFYNANNYTKITEFMKTFKYSNRIKICLQSTHPILNLNGNLCLKSSDLGDVIELPNGSGDFYHASIKGVSILEKLKLDKVEFVSCVDC